MSDLEDAIELVRIGAGKVGLSILSRHWRDMGRQQRRPRRRRFRGLGLARATTEILNPVLDGRLAPRRAAQEPAIDGRH
jgi:hypothetical protein